MRLVIDALGCRGAAAGRKDTKIEIRIALDQGAQPFGQQCSILRHIAVIDPVKHRIGGERIGVMHPRLVIGRWFHPAGPCRYAAVGIGGSLGAQWRQVLAQACGLSLVHLCLGLAGAKRQ